MTKKDQFPESLHPFIETNPLTAVIKNVRYEILGNNISERDIADICEIEARSWGSGTVSEQRIAFSEDEIRTQLSKFPGLNVIARASSGQPVGSAFLGRLPAGTDVINVPDTAKFIDQMTPDGPFFEESGIAVIRERRKEGIGANLTFAGQRAVVDKIIAEAFARYGSYQEVERHFDEVIGSTDSTASIRVNAYGAWLKDNELEHTQANLFDYYTKVCLGHLYDPVLTMNLSVMRRSGYLTSVIGLTGGCEEDEDSAKAGLRIRQIKLVRAFAEKLLQAKLKI